MRFSNDGSTWSDWEPFKTSRPNWDLALFGGSSGTGPKTVHCQVQDMSGLLSRPFTATIRLSAVHLACPLCHISWVAFSPTDPTLIAASYQLGSNAQPGVTLWDATSGRELFTFHAPAEGFTGYWVPDITFRPDGKVIAFLYCANPGGTICQRWDIILLEVPSGRKLRAISIPENELGLLSLQRAYWSTDGRALVVLTLTPGKGQVLRLWEASPGRELQAIHISSKCSGLESVAFSPDSKALATGCQYGEVVVWDVASGRDRLAWKRSVGYGGFRGVAFSPDGRTLGAWGFGAIVLWDLRSGKEIYTIEAERYGTIWLASFSPDWRVVVSYEELGDSRTVKVRDLATGRLLHTLSGHETPVNSLAFSPDGRTVASASEGKIKLWDVATGGELKSWDAWGYPWVSFSADGKAIVGRLRGRSGLVVWDVSDVVGR